MTRKTRPTVNHRGKLGWIYFIANHADDVVKIGFASDCANRLSDIQTGNHNRLLLETSVPAYRAAEQLIHERFAEYRIRGEWFRLVWEIETFWDDLFDYQMMRCLTPYDRPGTEFLADVESRPIDMDHLRYMLRTIDEPWPREWIETITGTAVTSAHPTQETL